MAGSTDDVKLQTDERSRTLRELDRLERLLGEAMPVLFESFRKLDEITKAQSDLLEHILRKCEAAEQHQARQRAREYETQIRETLHDAVVALQFEDMAVQLLGLLRNRISMTGRGTQAGGTHPMRTYGPVSAEAMQTGTVDLF